MNSFRKVSDYIVLQTHYITGYQPYKYVFVDKYPGIKTYAVFNYLTF